MRYKDTNTGFFVWFNALAELTTEVTLQLDENGERAYILQACFGICNVPRAADTQLELTLYNSDLTTLSGSSFILEAETNCRP